MPSRRAPERRHFHAGDYTIGYVNGQLTVNPVALTVTANNQAKNYGSTFTFTGSEFAPAGLQNGETIGSVTLASAGAPATAHVAGSPYAITPAPRPAARSRRADYTIGYVNGQLTVNPVALTVTANNQPKTYGQNVHFHGQRVHLRGTAERRDDRQRDPRKRGRAGDRARRRQSVCHHARRRDRRQLHAGRTTRSAT